MNDDQLGRKLLAALMAYQMGNKSIDYTLRRYVGDDPIDPVWQQIGENLLRFMCGTPFTPLDTILKGRKS